MIKESRKNAYRSNFRQLPLFLASSALWQDNFSKFSQYAFHLVSNIHCIIILLFTQFKLINSDLASTYLSGVRDIIQLLTFKEIYTQENKSLLLNLFFIIIWIYFIVLLNAFHSILKAFKHDRSLARTSNHFFTFMGQLHLAFGFWFINVVIMDKLSIFQQDYYRVGGLTNNGYFMSTFSTILIILNYTMGIYFSIFSRDPFPNSNELAVHSVGYQVLTFVFKAIIAPLLMFGALQNLETAKWIISLLSAVLLISRHLVLMGTFPYYHFTPMKMTCILSSTGALVSIITFLSICAAQSDLIIMNNVLVIELILCYLLFTSCRNVILKKMMNNLEADDRQKTEMAVIKKLFSLRYITKYVKLTLNDCINTEYNELCYAGMLCIYRENASFVEDFKKKCVKPTSNENANANSLNSIRSFYTRFDHRILIDMLNKAIERLEYSGNTVKLKIILDCLYLEQDNSLLVSLMHFARLGKKDTLQTAIAERLGNKIQQKTNLLFTGNDGKVLDMKAYIDLEEISTRFLQKIYHNTIKYIEFWAYYSKDDLKVKELLEKSKKIEEHHELIEKYWNNKISKHRNFAASLSMIYSIYLSIVKSRPSLASKIIDKDRFQKDIGWIYDSKNEPLSQNNLNSAGTMAFHVSMSRDKLGKILYVSSNVKEVLGWTKFDTVGRNISIILPSMMQEWHNVILLNHLNQASDNINAGASLMNQNIESFIKDKAGYVLPCYVYLSVHPYVQQDDLVYIALVRLGKTKKYQLLMNESGNIEEYSRETSRLLGLAAGRKVYIKDVCEDYHLLEPFLKKKIQTSYQDEFLQKRTTLTKKSFADKPSRFQSLGSPGLETSQLDYVEDYDYKNSIDFILKFQTTQHFARGQASESQSFFVQMSVKKFQGLNFFVLDLSEHKNKGHIYTTQPQDRKDEALNDNEIPDIPTEKPVQEGTEILTSPALRAMSKYSELKGIEQYNSSGTILTDKKEEKTDTCMLTTGRGEKDQLLTTTQRNRENPVQQMKGNKGVIMQMLNVNKDIEGEVSVASTRNRFVQVEKAVGIIPKDVQLKILKIIGFMFIVISAALLVAFSGETSNTLDTVKGDINILSKASLKLTCLCYVNRFARFYILSNQSLLLPTRYDFAGSPMPTLYAYAYSIPRYLGDLTELSNDIWTSLHAIDENLRNDLYMQIPIHDTLDSSSQGEIVEKMNIFELVTEIYIKITALLQVSNPYTVPPTDSNLVFLLNNTLNSPLIRSEETVTILLEDAKIKFAHQKDYMTLLIVGIVLSGLIVWGLFYIAARRFVTKRNQFIDILLRLDETYIQQNNTIIAKFSDLLANNYMDYKSINMRLDQDSLILPSVKKQNCRNIHKEAIRDGINIRLVALSLMIFCFLMLALTMYLIIFGVMNNQSSSIKHKIDLMATSNLNLYKSVLLFTTLYEYVGENKTTELKNKPIQEEWESIYVELTKSSDTFINDMLDENIGLGSNSDLVNLITGDICKSVPPDVTVAEILCVAAQNILGRGIIGLNSFQLGIFQRVKSYYESSQHTFADQFTALNMDSDLPVLELVDHYFTYNSYKKVDDLIRQTIFDDIDASESVFTITISIFVVIWTILGFVFWYKITQALETETNSWRNILKQVPFEILVTSKLFMNFLFTDSNHSFARKLHG